MKKILILAYDFPPYVSVGGLRPYSWYKYFKEFGFYPVVVTRQWSNKHRNYLDYIAPSESNEIIIEETEFGTILRTPYKPNFANRLLLKYGEHKFRLIRKIITGYYEFIQFLFLVGPKSALYRGAKEYLKNNKVDLIIATGDPFILFKYASNLSKKYKIPWIADYRDPWTQDKSRVNNWFYNVYFSYFEKKITINVKLIITVNDFSLYKISKGLKNKTFEIIFNGYNPENFTENIIITQKNNFLTLAFTGTINKWHPIKQFLAVLNNFCNQEKSQININFYGINNTRIIENFIKTHNPKFLKIELYDKIPNNQLIKILNEYTDILVLFNDYYILGTKIFDYLALRKKILFCFSEDKEAEELKNKYYIYTNNYQYDNIPQIELIKETDSGIIVKDQNHLYEVLRELYEEFSKNNFIKCNTHGYEFFSRKNQTERLSKIISKIIENENCNS